MIIHSFNSERIADRVRVSAQLTWEDCERRNGEIYFETHASFAEALTCNPHAFLVACAVPAMYYGEKRVSIDAEICPELHNGLLTALRWIHHWRYNHDNPFPRIEAKTKSSVSTSFIDGHAGLFFSGGIDAFSILRSNQLNFPAAHPLSIKDGLLVYGFEIYEPRVFDLVFESFSEIAQDIGITLIPVYTNIYLDFRQEDAANDFNFWAYEFMGAAFAAIAHAFAKRLKVVTLASNADIPHLEPFGSHPLIDANYSSIDLRIRHDGILLSRLDKTILVGDWDVALNNLRVCNLIDRYRPGMLNCGQCPKCIKTMLTLLALGKLSKSRAFPAQDVSPEQIIKFAWIYDSYTESSYKELIPILAGKERHDLVKAIETKVSLYHNPEIGWKQRIRQFDKKHLNDSLRRLIAYVKTRTEILSRGGSS
jgi:hypothetical protein